MITCVEWVTSNARRYSRPWIAKVTTWPFGGRAELAWGVYRGGPDGGLLEIEAEVGDVIRYGQKDGQRWNPTSAKYALALADGKVLEIDELTAVKYYRSSSEDRETLLAEMVRRRDQRDALIAEHEAWMQAQREAGVDRWVFFEEYERRTNALNRALSELSIFAPVFRRGQRFNSAPGML